MTFKGIMALILRYFTEFGSFRAHCVKVYIRARCRRKEVYVPYLIF